MMILQVIFFTLFSFAETELFYPQSYTQGRDVFRARSEKLKKEFFEKAEIGRLPISSETVDIPLTTDYLYIPQDSTEKSHLLILTSGVHGAEAFTGSAIQSDFLRKLQRQPKLSEKMGLLIVHSVNPYGFHQNRRVTENNVDLNRNFILDPSNYQKKSPEYIQLSSFLNPEQKLNYGIFNKMKFYFECVYLLLTQGRRALVNAIAGGQYSIPKGVFYGGQEPEENVQKISQLFKDKASGYENIFHIDLHTGYGERGTLHFFTTNKVPKKVQELRNRIFKGHSIDTGDDENFYEISGEFTIFTMKAFPDKSVIPMTFEFGTSDSQTTTGALFSLRSMVQENQAFHHGTTDKESLQSIQEDFSELFNPSSQDWRKKVMTEAQETLNQVLERFVQK